MPLWHLPARERLCDSHSDDFGLSLHFDAIEPTWDWLVQMPARSLAFCLPGPLAFSFELQRRLDCQQLASSEQSTLVPETGTSLVVLVRAFRAAEFPRS